MDRQLGILWATLAVAGLLPTGNVRADEPKPAPATAAQVDFFETKVRPLLVESCHKCHAAEKHKGGLRLDSRGGVLAGGDSGPAVVPGKPDESLLIEAVKYESLEMPPTGKLNDRDIAVLTEWVRQGAYWPGDEGGPATRHGEFQITEDDRRHWSFQPVARPQVPALREPGRASNPVDNFVIARLEGRGIEPNPRADRRVLIRRLYFDLIGLPPTADEIDAFAADDSPLAYERLVDRLLASPHYGERWGRHWLDLVRFAQTNGYERDDEKPEAWRFRDYVIHSLNDDKPYDRFLREQLAGDELEHVTRESLIATGFYRLGVWDDEPDDRRAAEFDELDEILKTTGSAFLGLTLGCARCHDHKFDPIPQEDYYRLLAYFRNVEPYGAPKSDVHFMENENGIFTPLPTAEQAAAWKMRQQELQAQLGQLKEQMAALEKQLDPATQEKKKQLEEEIKRVNEALHRPPFERALSVREPQTPKKETHVLVRGNAATPGKRVEPGLPRIFGGADAAATVPVSTPGGNTLRGLLDELGVSRTPGLRRALADWIADAANPLTARVFVNRVWQHHFGRGIVRSADNFGIAGDAPTHPELLDWLAKELIDSGYQVKRLHRLIVTSSTYCMSSSADNPRAASADSANDLFWRQNLRRLDAEAIRDAQLAVSGRLFLAMGGRGIFPALSQEVLATQSRPGHGWGESSEAERSRRSIYIYVKRTLMVPMLEAFDYTNTAETLGVRPVTTVAPQALMLLNSEFIAEQSAALCDRVLNDAGPSGEAGDAGEAGRGPVDRAFRYALGRSPTADERELAEQLMARQAERFRASGAEPVSEQEARRRALRSLCLVLLNLNEFVYVD